MPLKSRETLEPVIDGVDLGLLLADALGAKPVGDGQRLRMIGEAEVLQTQRLGRQRHFLDTVADRRCRSCGSGRRP
jgi:hypothetical protein